MGILGVVVRIHLFGVFRRHHRAAHKDDRGLLHSVQQPDGLFHGGQCGGHQGGQAHQAHPLLLNRPQDGLRRHIPAQVQHLVAVISQYGFHNIFANVMNVALHSGNDEFSLLHGHTALGGDRAPDDLEYCLCRNLNATKALLLGLSMEGVHNVLVVTGDPIPTEDRNEVKSVFNFNSRKLARFVHMLNENTLRTPFRIYGALNLNARNFDVELRRAQEKEACGVSGFLTQPVLSAEALDNLKLAHKTLRGKILGGIFPVVSHRNACFLNNEISGMRVCDEIIHLYEGKDRDAAEALAVTVSTAIAKEIFPYTDGYYLMTPFRRVALMEHIIQNIQQSCIS